MKQLTWQDIAAIRQIMFEYNKDIREGIYDGKPIPNDEKYCKEVLNRLNSKK